MKYNIVFMIGKIKKNERAVNMNKFEKNYFNSFRVRILLHMVVQGWTVEEAKNG